MIQKHKQGRKYSQPVLNLAAISQILLLCITCCLQLIIDHPPTWLRLLCLMQCCVLIWTEIKMLKYNWLLLKESQGID